MSKKIRKQRGKISVAGNAPQWLICAEGESEIYYLQGFVEYLAKGKKHGIHFGTGKECRQQEHGACKRQHVALLEQIEKCAAGKYYEKIWIVSDYDAKGEQKKQNEVNFKEMINRTSGDEYVRVAWTIPQFEYYLALHDSNYIATTSEQVYAKTIQKLVDESIKKKLHCDRRGALEKCLKKRKIICEEAESKPYCNSFIALGGYGVIILANLGQGSCNSRTEFC